MLKLSEALTKAEEAGLDLVLMNPNSNPAVCKLMDYPKYKFDAIKKEKDMRKNQKFQEVKEIQLSMRIDDYHVSFKLKNAQKFLEAGNKVKVSLRMQGRERARSEVAVATVNSFVEKLSAYGTADKAPQVLGKFVNVVISPKKQ